MSGSHWFLDSPHLQASWTMTLHCPWLQGGHCLSDSWFRLHRRSIPRLWGWITWLRRWHHYHALVQIQALAHAYVHAWKPIPVSKVVSVPVSEPLLVPVSETVPVPVSELISVPASTYVSVPGLKNKFQLQSPHLFLSRSQSLFQSRSLFIQVPVSKPVTIRVRVRVRGMFSNVWVLNNLLIAQKVDMYIFRHIAILIAMVWPLSHIKGINVQVKKFINVQLKNDAQEICIPTECSIMAN